MNKPLIASVSCSLMLAACSDRATAPQDAMPAAVSTSQAVPTSTYAAGDSMPSEASIARSDGFALGLLATIDQHEIDAAKQASEKNVRAAVMTYAAMMEREHGTNLAKTQALGPAMDDPGIATMKAKGDGELQELGAKSGAEYEKAYMAAMVSGHQEALAAIDDKMMPAATRDEVKQHLVDTRKAVEAHLAMAKDIAAKL